jgi:hypothetical protein
VSSLAAGQVGEPERQQPADQAQQRQALPSVVPAAGVERDVDPWPLVGRHAA